MRTKPFFRSVFMLLFLTGCAADSETSSVSFSSDQIDILKKFNCEQTVSAYAHSRDQIDWKNNVALFTEDAVMKFGPLRFEGREEIKQALLDRGPKSFNRHIISSVMVAKGTDNSFSGTSYAVVYGADPKIDGPKPLTGRSVEAILTYNDIFEVNEERCLIAERSITLDMVRKNE